MLDPEWERWVFSCASMDLWLIEALETLDLKHSHTQKHTGAIPPIPN